MRGYSAMLQKAELFKNFKDRVTLVYLLLSSRLGIIASWEGKADVRFYD